MLLKEARDGFLFDCECRHLAKGSIRNDRAETKFLMEFLELKQITEVEGVKAHHTAAYYCSDHNPKYGKMFNELTECVKDRELQKRYFFTTKAFGIGTEIKDRTVKHLYILMKSLLFRREYNHTSANASKVRSVLFRL